MGLLCRTNYLKRNLVMFSKKFSLKIFLSLTALGLFRTKSCYTLKHSTHKIKFPFIKHEWHLGNNSSIIYQKIFLSYTVFCHRGWIQR